MRTAFAPDLHRSYIKRVSSDESAYEYTASEHLRMSGVYWAAAALELMDALDELDSTAIVEFVLSCQHSCGGFGGNVNHDPHILYTLSAVQILVLFNALHRLDAERVLWYVSQLQQPDGSVHGEWTLVDAGWALSAAQSVQLAFAARPHLVFGSTCRCRLQF